MTQIGFRCRKFLTRQGGIMGTLVLKSYTELISKERQPVSALDLLLTMAGSQTTATEWCLKGSIPKKHSSTSSPT